MTDDLTRAEELAAELTDDDPAHIVRAADRVDVAALLRRLVARCREAEKSYWNGYENGESSQLADWICALQEIGCFPDDAELSPMAVAQEFARLRAASPNPKEAPDAAT